MGNFNPLIGKTQTITAAGSSSGITLGADSRDLMLVNGGTATAFYRTGIDTATAVATTDTPILAGAMVIFAKPAGHNYVAAVGSGSLYVTPGSGE